MELNHFQNYTNYLTTINYYIQIHTLQLYSEPMYKITDYLFSNQASKVTSLVNN